ncbi:MAG: hypothetical protein KKG14_07230 [Alphaproteobacteria bacterium]|nr:hypothetical protein [Alphaproteobacteria bacterium]MBU2271472.1 hypothetical protein [Alphaproteobacteria bacterium]MBU2418478.1 hypothetical protein [Alphaproteobacteria bacterium]
MSYARHVRTALTATVIMLAATSAAADGVSVSIHGRVGTVCRVEVGGPPAPRFEVGETRLGRMTELCNNVDGYRLVLSHPVGLQDAWMVVDGQRIPISPTSSTTVIVDSNGPAAREREVGIVLSSASDTLDLTLRAEAKGAIF